MLSEPIQAEKVGNIKFHSYVGYKKKATNEQTRKTNKQKLTDADNSMEVTKGKRVAE